jgi:hypothetical protein
MTGRTGRVELFHVHYLWLGCDRRRSKSYLRLRQNYVFEPVR